MEKVKMIKGNFASGRSCHARRHALKAVKSLIYSLAVLSTYQSTHLPTCFWPRPLRAAPHTQGSKKSYLQSCSFDYLPIYPLTNFASGCNHRALKTVKHLIYCLAFLTTYQPTHLPTLLLAAAAARSRQ